MAKQVPTMTAAELRAWRERLMLTQREAAEALGCSKRAVEEWEAGKPIAHTVLLATRWIEEHPELRRRVWRFEVRIAEPGQPGRFKRCYANVANVKDALWLVGNLYPTASMRGPDEMTLAEAAEEAGQDLPLDQVTCV